MLEISVTTTPFPQSGTTPTLGETLAELASYTGGEENPQVLARALRSYKTAIRMFNTVLWKFNRLVDDITLSSGSDFSLEDDFAAPMRACLVNGSGEEVQPVIWLEWGPFQEYSKPRVGAISAPEVYTCRNAHETGLVTVAPTLSATLTYPTLRVYYFRRILTVSADDDRLNVPEEVYQAIFQTALAIHLSKTETGNKAAVSDWALAAKLRQDVEQRWRDWEDFTH